MYARPYESSLSWTCAEPIRLITASVAVLSLTVSIINVASR